MQLDETRFYAGNLNDGRWGANLDLARISGPYFAKMNGTGVSARAIKPTREDAHWDPSFWYIWVANNLCRSEYSGTWTWHNTYREAGADSATDDSTRGNCRRGYKEVHINDIVERCQLCTNVKRWQWTQV